MLRAGQGKSEPFMPSLRGSSDRAAEGPGTQTIPSSSGDSLTPRRFVNRGTSSRRVTSSSAHCGHTHHEDSMRDYHRYRYAWCYARHFVLWL